MDRRLERPDSPHPARVALAHGGLAAAGVKALDPRAGRMRRGISVLGRSPVVDVGPITTDCITAKVQLVKFILAGQIPVAIAATVVGSCPTRRITGSNSSLHCDDAIGIGESCA